jgi:hypothetical protein
MKIIVLLLALAGAAWYLLFDLRKLDEGMVRSFYEATAHAVLSRDPDAQCDLISPSAELRLETLMSGKLEKQTLNHSQACEQLRKSHQFFTEMGDKAGGTLTIEYEYTLGDVQVAADHNSATVSVTSTLKMGEGFMQFRTQSTERLVRRWGRMQLDSSDAKTTVQWIPGAMADPSQYFKSP